MPAPSAVRPGLLAVCCPLAAVPAPPPRRSRDAGRAGSAAHGDAPATRLPDTTRRGVGGLINRLPRDAGSAGPVSRSSGAAGRLLPTGRRAGPATEPVARSRPRGFRQPSAGHREAQAVPAGCREARIASAAAAHCAGLPAARRDARYARVPPAVRRARVFHVKHSFLSVSSGIAQNVSRETSVRWRKRVIPTQRCVSLVMASIIPHFVGKLGNK